MTDSLHSMNAVKSADDAPRFGALARWNAMIAAAPRAEIEQAALRIAIGSIVLIYLIGYTFKDGIVDPHEFEVDAVAIAYVLFGILVVIRILASPQLSVVRRVLGMIADNAVTSYCLIRTGEAGAVVLGVYLFVAFGNGFRYGRHYLHASQALALAGFTTVLLVSPFWSQHVGIGFGLLISMVVLPFYVGVLAERINEARKRADEANRAKGRFLANVSHEMRTPLNGVIAMADVLRETDLTEAQAEIVETLGTSANLLLVQIEDVLDMAKIEAGRVQIERRPFNLHQMLSSVGKVVSTQASQKGITFSLEIAEDLGNSFVGDAHHLRQVLLNLVSNAVKFTKQGEVSLSATCSHKNAASLLRFEVRDTGIGIAAEKLSSIFEPFTQADDSITRLYGGTGLGTTIARQLTILMGGSIGVESTEGIGSLFWVQVPLEPCAPESVVNDFAQAQLTPLRADKQNMRSRGGARILVAEDNPTNQRVVQLVLEAGGHRATIVSSGEQALDALETGNYDLALFDLSMPVVSGLEALKMYRYTADKPIPILILSAHVTADVIAECMDSGAAEFVAKPIRSSGLLEAISRHYSGNAAVRANTPQPTEGRPALSVIETPAVDPNVLADLDRLSSDPTFVARLIDGFRTDLERLISEIAEGTASKKHALVKDAAHALKGGAGSVGANELVMMATRFEKATHQTLEAKGQEWCNELQRAATSALDSLARHVHGPRQSVRR